MSVNDDLRRRMSRVIDEYLQLDTALRKAEGTHFRVSIFGSARLQPEDSIYQCVYEVSRKLALMGADIVTGGGPGLMEAANRAVRDAGVKRVRSYGLPLDIPGLQEVANAHLDIKSMHRKFSSRLDEFMRLSDGVIVAPGGIGTLLELYYVWQLLQLSMIDPRPVVLLGRAYWSGLIEWMEAVVLPNKLISPVDMTYVQIVETPDEAVAAIAPAYEAFHQRRRDERENLKKARVATLQKVEEEVEATEEMLEDARKEPYSATLDPAGNGSRSPAGASPARTKGRNATSLGIVTPIDAANLSIRAESTSPLRRRRRRVTRRR